MAKTKKKKPKKKPRPKAITYKVTAYQIHIKGPERNKAFNTLLDGLRERLISGKPLVKADRFGNVVRSLSGVAEEKIKSLTLNIVKFNTRNTGLSWDIKKDDLVDNDDRVTAQKTELIIFPEEHIAYHVHKPHGPSTEQIEKYLFSIFEIERQRQKLDCTIEVEPGRVGGEIKRVHKWKIIKKFVIQVIRPNPSGTVVAKQLKDLLAKTDSDKVGLELSANVKTGLNKSNISELIDEGDKLVSEAQGRVQVEGINASNHKDSLDSKDVKVKYHEIKTDISDLRSLAEIIKFFFS